MFDLRHGRFQDTLADATWDHAIFDAPYGERTHAAHDNAVSQLDPLRHARGRGYEAADRREITYTHWTSADVAECCDFICPRTAGWVVSITDHHLGPVWTEHLERHGLYVFSPLAFVHPGSRVRLAGDGPAQWSVWIIVARPRNAPYSKWGSLSGAFVMPKGLTEPEDKREIGGKPLWLMRELVKEYSRPGDRVCDPCMGWGTTGVAAIREGREFIGSEVRKEAFDHAQARIAKPFQSTIFAPLAPAAQPKLLDL